jgi:hypothetical protein
VHYQDARILQSLAYIFIHLVVVHDGHPGEAAYPDDLGYEGLPDVQVADVQLLDGRSHALQSQLEVIVGHQDRVGVEEPPE